MKSKEQKREEAMLRARNNLPKHRAHWIECQPGGGIYEPLKRINPERAEIVRQQADLAFDRAAAHAGTDRHGNPLK